jgi:hypothetical protein
VGGKEKKRMTLLARIGLALLLLAVCRPGLAQEQRPSIRVVGNATDTHPLVLARSYGPGPLKPWDTDVGSWSDETKQSMGCLIGGVAGTAVALLAGGAAAVNVIAGGGLAPANPVVLYTGLAGVVFASFCAVGQALTPLFLYYFANSPEPQVHVLPGAGVRDIRPAVSR